jgi:hypothetical protein
VDFCRFVAEFPGHLLMRRFYNRFPAASGAATRTPACHSGGQQKTAAPPNHFVLHVNGRTRQKDREIVANSPGQDLWAAPDCFHCY